MANLLDSFLTYMVSEGRARQPRVAGANPPLWRHPGTGAPAPGEKEGVENDANLVLSAFLSDGVPAPRFEEARRKQVVDVWFRSTTFPRAEDHYKLMRESMVGHGPNVKTEWMMGPTLVIESIEWRPFQFLSYDNNIYSFTWGLMIETLVI